MFWRAILPLWALFAVLNAKTLHHSQEGQAASALDLGIEAGWLGQLATLLSGAALTRYEMPKRKQPVSTRRKYSVDDLVNIANLKLRDVQVTNLPESESSKVYLRVLLFENGGSSVNKNSKPIPLVKRGPSASSAVSEVFDHRLFQKFTRLRLEVFNDDLMLLDGEIRVEEMKEQGTFKVPRNVSQKNEPQLSFHLNCDVVQNKTFDDFQHVQQSKKLEKSKTLVDGLNKFKDNTWKLVNILSKQRDFPIPFADYKVKFGDDFPNFPAFAAVAPVSKQLKPETWSKGVRYLMQGLYSFAGGAQKPSFHDDTLLEYWESFFTDLDMPKNVETLIKHWKEDYYFARQFLQSVNPFQIKFVDNIEQVPKDMRSLTSPSGDLQTLIDQKRLLIADYHELATIHNLPAEPQGHFRHKDRPFIFYAPYVLFYAGEEELPKHNLNVLGIQLTRHADIPNQVFTPESKPHIWLYAKILVQNADIQVDAINHHLGLCHIAMEPFAVAYHNLNYTENYILTEAGCENRKKHILAILEPHLENVIGINSLARQTLLQTDIGDPIIQGIFSVAIKPHGLHMLDKVFKEYNYEKFHYKKEMASRGFGAKGKDFVSGYFYRDDGDLLWEGLERYVKAAVDDYYESDHKVAQDVVLQNFFFTVYRDGKFNGLKDPKTGTLLEIKTKAVLVDVLTAIIFHASAFHAIENSAMDSKSFIPNKPESLTLPMPPMEKDADLNMKYIEASFPNYNQIMFQSLAAYTLGSPSAEPLSKIKAWPSAKKILDDHFVKMKKVISERDRQLQDAGQITYPFFDPDLCNASVDI